MRKVILRMNISLDGFVAPTSGAHDWVFRSFDDELEKYTVDQFWEVGTHIMGRVTYHEMAEHWPSSTAKLAPPMNEIPKVIFSKTLKETNWNNSQVVDGDIAEEIYRLKQQPGKDIMAHGGWRFAQSLSRLGLIDEYRLIVNPIAFGSGVPLFKDLPDSINLNLLSTKVFKKGAVLQTYQPVRSTETSQENAQGR
ncbi:dihydrofolate reductase family protein [Alkalihalobacillus oceani]|uniref:dihydrofolate reductase family protein n=1 Tax=Halalkalibacter oceani TaxID=1653776 RepID=UPI00203E7BD6|nr:dihydrofolate reductase family protein [Halalkalibacter oceani]MCM3761105.1 dihydrofolate reductase family protein [Halalkalibacter oceani]